MSSHTLHTTPAFVLQSFPHGESNRVYKLLTRDKGLLYAHVQGVRDMRNRNRYALKTHTHTMVTLVRGREVWRVTSAYAHESKEVRLRRVLVLVGRMLPVEDAVPALFTTLMLGENAYTKIPPELHAILEVLCVLRVLDQLGYLATLRAPLSAETLTGSVCDRAFLEAMLPHKTHLVGVVNEVLQVL